MIKKFEQDSTRQDSSPAKPAKNPNRIFAERLGESSRLHERAVPLFPDLGEVADRGASRIGNEMEPVSGAGKRGNVHFDFARVLDEISSELILWIRGRKRGLPLHSAPTHFEGVENGSNRMTHRMARVQAVRNSEGIERAVISDVQYRLSLVKIDPDAGGRCQIGPKQSGA